MCMPYTAISLLNRLCCLRHICVFRIQSGSVSQASIQVACAIYVYRYSGCLWVGKMESCLCHILFFIIMIDWKSFYANGGYSNGNSDPLSYENGCDDEDEEYNDIMREEWHRRMEEE